MIDRAMLMAAGLGTRLRPFTETTPKPLLPVFGVPMAQFALDALSAAGVGKIVANIHHLPELARAGLGALDTGGAELSFSDESARILGSAGGLRKALPFFEGKPFFVVNADVLCDVDLRALERAHERLRAQWGVKVTLAVFRRAPGRGEYREIVFDEERGLIARLGETRRGSALYVGLAVVEPEAIEPLREGPSEFVPEILEPAIAEGKAGVFLSSGRWHDVGAPALWLDAHLEIMAALETGHLARPWRLRIEERNRRVAEGQWAKRGASALPRFGRVAGPCYWAGEGSAESFGPRAVLYGRPTGPGLSDGIGYGGQWVGVAG